MISARTEHLLIKLQSLKGSAVCTTSVIISSSGPNFPLVFCTTACGLKGFPAPSVKELFFGKTGPAWGRSCLTLGSLVTGCNCWGRCEGLEIRNYKAKSPRKQSKYQTQTNVKKCFSGAERNKKDK